METSTSATRRARAISALAVTALALALSACGSTASSSSPASSGDSLYRQLVVAYVSYARCARSRGLPNLPDPQVDDQGNDHYPALDRLGHWRWPESVLVGCATAWDRVHAIRDRFDSQRLHTATSTATYAQQLALARCIRAHGFPTYPDPNADGAYVVGSLPSGFVKPELSPQALAAISACNSRKAP
jgi:hypothetical protein